MDNKRDFCLYCKSELDATTARKKFCSTKCRVYFYRSGSEQVGVSQPKVKTILVNEFTDERLVIYRFLDKMIDSNPLFIEKLRALCKSPNVQVAQSVNVPYVELVENKPYEARTKTVNEYALERRELPQDDEMGYFKWLDKLEADPNLTAKQKSLAKSL